MNEWLLISVIILAILVLIGLIIIFIVLRKKKEGKIQEPNYQAFLPIGITFLGAGVVLSIAIDKPGFIGLTALGLTYMMIGLANKDKWIK